MPGASRWGHVPCRQTRPWAQVTALGRAWGYLLECDQMSWQQVEHAVTRPYTCELAANDQCWCPVSMANLLGGAACLSQAAAPLDAAPLSFWQFSNRMYRCFGMALMADALRVSGALATGPPCLDVARLLAAECRGLRRWLAQHAAGTQAADQQSRVWLLKHWLLCLLDRGRRFATGEGRSRAARLGVFPFTHPPVVRTSCSGVLDGRAGEAGTVCDAVCRDAARAGKEAACWLMAAGYLAPAG